MQSQSAGFGIVAQAGGVVGAHLEEHAHLKFAECLAAEKTVYVIVSITGGDDVETEPGAFADQIVQHDCRIGCCIGFPSGKAKILLITEPGVFLEAVDEQLLVRFGVFRAGRVD